MSKEYVKINGETSKYDYSEYQKEYNKRRNKTIDNLQKRKSYYKRIGNIEKMKSCQILIDIEKRRK